MFKFKNLSPVLNLTTNVSPAEILRTGFGVFNCHIIPIQLGLLSVAPTPSII